MTLGPLAAWTLSYWPYLAAGVPALWSLIYNLYHFGWGSVARFYYSILRLYVGTLYSLNVAWLAIQKEFLLQSNSQNSWFVGIVTAVIFVYFLARSADGTPFGARMRKLFDRALWGARPVYHPLLPQYRALEKLRRSMRKDGLDTIPRLREEVLHVDSTIQTLLPDLKLAPEAARRITEAGSACRELLKANSPDASALSKYQDALAVYCGTLQAIIMIRPKPKVGSIESR